MAGTQRGSRPYQQGPRTPTLFSKQGLVIADVARVLLAIDVGQRIERIQTYALRFNASVGTVQAALDYLQTVGAARLEARGRLGTFASALNYPVLWSLAQQRPVVGALPLPYSRRFEGLATGVRLQFGLQPLDLDLRFMRGAPQRLQALAAHTLDWALVSRFAAETAHAHGFAIETVLELGSQSYMAHHALLLSAGASTLENGMRIGVDQHSADHVYITRAISRGYHVELVPIEYNQGLHLITSGALDAIVWSQEDIPVDFNSLTIVPLDPDREPALATLSEGVVVIDQGNHAITHVLAATLDRRQLIQIQRDVIDRNRLPTY